MCILFASRTQEIIALSSGEAELYAIGSGTSEGLFVVNFLKEVLLASRITLSLLTDSTSGKSMATRFGVSKRTRHIDVKFLYMQELVQRGLLKVKKVLGTENCADIGTKYVDFATLCKHIGTIGILERYILEK